MINKNLLNQMRYNYTKIPTKLISCGLSPQAISIYVLMAALPESFHPSIQYIKSCLQLSPTTIIKYIQELENRNIIKQLERGFKGKRSKYMFVNPKDWKSNNN